jgi:hypothetical protein
MVLRTGCAKPSPVFQAAGVARGVVGDSYRSVVPHRSGKAEKEEQEWRSESAVAPAAKPQYTPAEVMNLLNLRRNVDGYWPLAAGASQLDEQDKLLLALVSQVAADGAAPPSRGGSTAGGVGAAAAAAAAGDSGLSGEQWLAVLALAFLRKRCGGPELRGVWEGLEAKALAWLEAGWPAGARPLGFAILAASKLV